MCLLKRRLAYVAIGLLLVQFGVCKWVVSHAFIRVLALVRF